MEPDNQDTPVGDVPPSARWGFWPTVPSNPYATYSGSRDTGNGLTVPSLFATAQSSSNTGSGDAFNTWYTQSVEAERKDASALPTALPLHPAAQLPHLQSLNSTDDRRPNVTLQLRPREPVHLTPATVDAKKSMQGSGSQPQALLQSRASEAADLVPDAADVETETQGTAPPPPPQSRQQSQTASAPQACLRLCRVAILVIFMYALGSGAFYYLNIREDHDRIGTVTLLPTDGDVGTYIDELVNLDDALGKIGILRQSRALDDDARTKRLDALRSELLAERGTQAEPTDRAPRDATRTPGYHADEVDPDSGRDDVDELSETALKLLAQERGLSLFDARGSPMYDMDIIKGFLQLRNRAASQQQQQQPSDVPSTDTAAVAGDVTSIMRSRTPTDVLALLLEMAPPVAPPMLDLCGPIPQFNPVRGEFNVKLACWDNLYYNAILKLLSPRAWNATTELHMRREYVTPRVAQARARKEQTRLDEAFSRMRDSQKARLLDLHRDCLCSDHVGFPGAFVVVCDVVPDASGNAVHRVEPSCRVLFYPSLVHPTLVERYDPRSKFSIVSSNVAYLADHVGVDANGNVITPDTASTTDAVQAEARTLSRQDAIHREFHRRLNIQDGGHIMHNETITVSYYDLPDTRRMEFSYSPIISDAITAYFLIAGQKSRQETAAAQAFAHDPLKSVWDGFRDAYIGQDALAHEALKGVTRARETENANVAALGRQRLRRMESERAKRVDTVRGLVEGAARNIGLLRQEKNCSEFVDMFVYVQQMSEQVYDKRSGMSPACMQTLHSQPRLVHRTEQVNGHAARCVMQCVRQTDLLRIKKIEYDFHEPLRTLFSDELFVAALQKLQSDDAYSGIAFP